MPFPSLKAINGIRALPLPEFLGFFYLERACLTLTALQYRDQYISQRDSVWALGLVLHDHEGLAPIVDILPLQSRDLSPSQARQQGKL